MIKKQFEVEPKIVTSSKFNKSSLEKIAIIWWNNFFKIYGYVKKNKKF